MIRTQIQLSEEQAAMVKRLAAEWGVSMAEVIRRGLDAYLGSWVEVSEEERVERALSVAGRFRSGGADGSADHDRHLVEGYRM